MARKDKKSAHIRTVSDGQLEGVSGGRGIAVKKMPTTGPKPAPPSPLPLPYPNV